MTRWTPVVSALLLGLAARPAAAQSPVQAQQGCYVPGSGTVYLINVPGAPTTCATGHTAVTVQRPSVLANIFAVDSSYDLPPGSKAVHLDCPDSATAISMGFSAPMADIYGISTALRNGNGFDFGTFNVGSVTVAIAVEVYCVPK